MMEDTISNYLPLFSFWAYDLIVKHSHPLGERFSSG